MEELFVKKVYAGAAIFKEGELEPVMYHVVSGKVGIYSHYGRLNEKRLAVISAEDPNPYFGEMGLVDRTVRSATAVALEDCRLGAVTPDNFRVYLKKHPDLVMEMLRRMSGYLRTVTAEYVDACHVIAQQKAVLQAEKKPGPEWMNSLKKQIAIFKNPPTRAELAAFSVSSRSAAANPPENSTEPAVLEAKDLPAGTVLFDKGDAADCMYELMQGSVGIYADYDLPTQTKLAELSSEKNRFLGEMGMIEALPRSAAAVTETDCKLLTIDREQVNAYFVEDPELLLAALRQMSGSLREMTDDYMEAVKTIAENERHINNGSSRPSWLEKNLETFSSVWKNICAIAGPRL